MGEKVKTITVYNAGQQRFLIERSEKNADNKYLEPGQALEVSAELGEKLLKYKGVKDASKMVKNKTSEDQEKIIAGLKEKIEELEAKLKKLSK